MKTRKLKAYLRPSLTTFCRNLFERTEEKRRRIRADHSFQFSGQYKLTAILRRNIVSTYPRTMNSKNPGQKLSPCSEAKVTCSDTNTAKETNRKLLRSSTKTKPFFSNFEFGNPNPVALQRTVWWLLYNTLVSEQENISQAICYCLPALQFLQVQTKHRIHQQVHIPNISWWCENCPEWKEASNCYRQRWTIDFEAMFVNYVQFWIQFSQLLINKLLTKLARAVLGNIGPRSWQYGPRCARSILPWPRANIPQNGTRARLVSG